MPRRTIAIGDIHGCSLALDALLEAIDPGPDDLVVTLGDYIDRGLDSRGVIERLIGLAGRCTLVPLMGNHEQMFLDALAQRRSSSRGHGYAVWLDYGGIATLDSYGGGCGLEAIPGRHVAFLGACRDSFETETHFFAHGYYLPAVPLAEQPPAVLRWESFRSQPPEPHVSGKTAVVGHTPQKDGEVLDLGYLKCIDTYCYGGGWLTALDVLSGRVWQADERGTLRAR